MPGQNVRRISKDSKNVMPGFIQCLYVKGHSMSDSSDEGPLISGPTSE
jgi:hypothetical protein